MTRAIARRLRACRLARRQSHRLGELSRRLSSRAVRAAAGPRACCDRCRARYPGRPRGRRRPVCSGRRARTRALITSLSLAVTRCSCTQSLVLRANGDVPRLIADSKHEPLAGRPGVTRADRRRGNTCCCSPQPGRAQLPPSRRRRPRTGSFAHAVCEHDVRWEVPSAHSLTSCRPSLTSTTCDQRLGAIDAQSGAGPGFPHRK